MHKPLCTHASADESADAETNELADETATDPVAVSSAVLVATDGRPDRAALGAAVRSFPGIAVLGHDQAGEVQAEVQQSNAEVNCLAMGLVLAFTAIAVVNTLAMSTAALATLTAFSLGMTGAAAPRLDPAGYERSPVRTLAPVIATGQYRQPSVREPESERWAMRLRRTAIALAAGAALLGAGSLPAQAAQGAQTAPVAAAPHQAAAPAATGTLTTPDGRTYLADRQGRALQLHGLNLGKTDTVTEAGVAELAASGFNLVRLNIQWQKVEPRRGQYDTAYLRYLGQVMGWADRYGVLVLVDWHQDVFGPAFGFNGIPAWATRTDGIPYEPLPGDDWFANYFQPAVGAAFRHLYDDADLRAAQAAAYTKVAATLHGHRSLLGYDLFNEPFGPFTGDPTDPATQIENSAEMERGRLAGLYQRLIGAVRKADQDAWLFVEPTVLIGQGVPTQLPGFSDPRRGADRLGYAPHYYDTAVENGADWDSGDGFIEAYEAAVRAYPAAHRLPVLVGEWGPAKATGSGNAELIRRQIASMRGFATGWGLWYDCHAADGGGYCAYDANGRPAPGKEPVFAPYAPATAGTPGAESYDPATRTYTLALTTTAVSRHAWTELTLPATTFPHGARVSVTGARSVVHQAAGSASILLPATRPGTHVTLTITAMP